MFQRIKALVVNMEALISFYSQDPLIMVERDSQYPKLSSEHYTQCNTHDPTHIQVHTK